MYNLDARVEVLLKATNELNLFSWSNLLSKLDLLVPLRKNLAMAAN